MKLFYEPNNAYFGDCMPFYHDGTFYVFHQRDARNPRPFEPFEWSLATTKDFVHYEDKGVAIPKEGDDSPSFLYLSQLSQQLHGLMEQKADRYSRHRRNQKRDCRPFDALGLLLNGKAGG